MLARYESFTIAQAAPTYTADGRGMVGAVPDIDGLYVRAGCNEAGITHGPGYGKLLAEDIVDGGARLAALETFRLDRFGDTLLTDRDVLDAWESVTRAPRPGARP